MTAAGAETGDGILLEGRSLTRLALWRTPGGLAVHSIYAAPGMAKFVAGCAHTAPSRPSPCPPSPPSCPLIWAGSARWVMLMHTLNERCGGAGVSGYDMGRDRQGRGVACSANAMATEPGSAVRKLPRHFRSRHEGTAAKGFLGNSFGGKN
jgi:hypothetical protein